MKRFLRLVYLAVLLSSCIPLPDGPGRRITDQPELSKLTGKYVITPESENFLKKSGFDQNRSIPRNFITLNSDGSCLFEGWSTYNNLTPEEEREQIQATGSWRSSLEKEFPAYVVVSLDLKTSKGEQIGRRFRLAKMDGIYVLWDWSSDPDERNYCIFKKEG